MAKSLRSKWKRKMRAEKRVRYGEKELNQLKKMLTEAGDYQMVPEPDTPPPDSEPITEESILMTSLPPRKTAKTRRPRPESTRKSRLDAFEDEDTEMTEDASTPMSVDKQPRVYSKRTLKDQFGNYPVWMSKRKVLTQKKKNKRIAKSRAKSVSGGTRKGRR